MEKLFLVSALMTVLSQVWSGDIPFHVTVTPNKTQQVSIGNTIVITCHITQNVISLLPSVPFVDVWHVREWNGKQTEKKIFEQTRNQPDISPRFYSMSSHPDNQLDNLIFTLTVTSLRRVDDGRFEFRIASQGVGDLFSKENEGSHSTIPVPFVYDDVNPGLHPNYSFTAGVDVVVYKDLTSVMITSKCNNSIVTSNDLDIMDVDAGDILCVTCEAEGSNPATQDIVIFFGDDIMTSGTGTSVPMTSLDVRQFRSSVDSECLTATPADDGKVIQCNARAPSGMQMMSKMTVRVRTFEPDISCIDTVAYTGQTSVQFDCFVDHTNVSLHIMQYRFNIGDRGVVLRVRDIEYNVATMLDSETKVKVERIKEDSTTFVDHLRLSLSTMYSSYFSTDFSLVVESSAGHMTRHRLSVSQVKKPSTTTMISETVAKWGLHGGTSMASYATVSVMTIVACLLSQHVLM